MKEIKFYKFRRIVSVLFCSFATVILSKKAYAMPSPLRYDYHNFSHSSAKNEILNNRAIVLVGSHGKKITVGNEKVAKKHRSRSVSSSHRLQLHHVFFKGIRNTFPGIPYLCMQTPTSHHVLYHNRRQHTDIDYNHFTNMKAYLDRLLISITGVANGEHDAYSAISITAANLAIEAQQYWIEQRYNWLYNIENGRVLLLAQRLLAKNCFPNNMIVNQYICEQKSDYLISELHLSHYALNRISSASPAAHLKVALKARFNMLKLYAATNHNIPNLNSESVFSSTTVYDLANQRYKDSERFHNPIFHMVDISGESSDSDASSLND